MGNGRLRLLDIDHLAQKTGWFFMKNIRYSGNGDRDLSRFVYMKISEKAVILQHNYLSIVVCDNSESICINNLNHN